MPSFTTLDDRGVIRVSGPDARAFLQGLVSNDVDKVSPERAIWSAFLTPQGKYLFDFMIAEHDGALLLEVEAARLADFAKRLRMYKLRSKVDLADESGEWVVAAVFGEGAAQALGLDDTAGTARAFAKGIAAVDPRLAALGARLLLPAAGGTAPLIDASLAETDRDGYEAYRIALGVPDGSRDLEVDKTVLLEAGFEELNGVDFQKGCYMGQELTARTKYRGLVKRRLMPVTLSSAVEPGTPVTLGEKEAGEIRSVSGNRAIAMLRLNVVEEAAGAPLTAGAATAIPERPAWMA